MPVLVVVDEGVTEVTTSHAVAVAVVLGVVIIGVILCMRDRSLLADYAISDKLANGWRAKNFILDILDILDIHSFILGSCG